jgi:hypothetical protein
MAGSTYAQQVRIEEILGFWEGSIVIEFDGKQLDSAVTFEFASDQTLKLSMSATQFATYKIDKNRIEVLFNDGISESFTLIDPKVSDQGLSARLSFNSDPPNLYSYIRLRKSRPRQVLNNATKDATCDGIDLTGNIQDIFTKYQFKCPIDVTENMKWYNVEFFSRFLKELVTADMAVSYPRVGLRPDVYVNTDGVTVLLRPVPSSTDPVGQTLVKFSTSTIEKSLLRYFKAFERLTVTDGEEGEQVAAKVFNSGQLKSKYVSSGFIDLDLVWNEVFNTAIKLDIRLDSRTELHTGNDRSIKESVARKIGESDGFHYFERVNVSMRDPSQNRRNVTIQIESEIFKRKGYSNYRQMVECVLNPATSASKLVKCAEAPYLKAVSDALEP